MRKAVISISAIIIACFNLHAVEGNDRPGIHGGLVHVQDNKIRLLAGDIVLDASRIIVSHQQLSRIGVPVQCRYSLKNISDDTIEVKFEFPFARASSGESEGINVNFTALENNKRVVTDRVKNNLDAFSYVWKIRYLPNEQKEILCEYIGYADITDIGGTGDIWEIKFSTNGARLKYSLPDTVRIKFILPQDADGYLNNALVKSYDDSYQKAHEIKPANYIKTARELSWTYVTGRSDTLPNKGEVPVTALLTEDINISFISCLLPDSSKPDVEKKYVLKTNNDLFLELFGPGIIGSINYSRNIAQRYSIRAGTCGIFNTVTVNKITSVKKRTWGEAGTGLVLVIGGNKVEYLWWSGSVYYCHKIEDLNLYYRIGLSSVVGARPNTMDDIPPLLSPSFGLGSRF
ncbi:hypothetical protein HZA73_11585 [candidate division TA06 bacterium]|nr:hypothetical protein [candidate division TA06 bacterium]